MKGKKRPMILSIVIGKNSEEEDDNGKCEDCGKPEGKCKCDSEEEDD